MMVYMIVLYILKINVVYNTMIVLYILKINDGIQHDDCFIYLEDQWWYTTRWLFYILEDQWWYTTRWLFYIPWRSSYNTMIVLYILKINDGIQHHWSSRYIKQSSCCIPSLIFKIYKTIIVLYTIIDLQDI